MTAIELISYEKKLKKREKIKENLKQKREKGNKSPKREGK